MALPWWYIMFQKVNVPVYMDLEAGIFEMEVFLPPFKRIKGI